MVVAVAIIMLILTGMQMELGLGRILKKLDNRLKFKIGNWKLGIGLMSKTLVESGLRGRL